MNPVSMTFSVIDGKNKGAQVQMYLVQEGYHTIESYNILANNVAIILKYILKGGIVATNISWRPDLSLAEFSEPNLGIPDPDSDVEEGGEFVFYDVESFIFRNRVPTFNEALLISGTRQIDITNSDVLAYVNLFLFGFAVGADEFFFSGARGEQVVTLRDAEEDFKKRRYKRRK